MDINERYNYLSIQYDRYKECTTRKEKSALLSETVEVAELDRKTVIRHFRKRPQRKKRRKQRTLRYDAPVQDVIHLVAKALNYPCAERLKAGLVDTADNLMRHGHIVLESEVRKKLTEISVSTIGRIRQRRQQDEPRLA